MKLQVLHLLIIGVIISAVSFETVLGLKCYQCNSVTDTECTELFDVNNEHLQMSSADCPVHNATYCIKTTGVWGAIAGTTRFCSSEDMYDQCQYVRYRNHDRVYRACVFTCTWDGCNGTSSLRSPNVLSLLILFVIVAFRHKLL